MMMRPSAWSALFLFCGLALPARAQLQPGGLLKPGMTLTYEAQGKRSAPWVVASVRIGEVFAGRTGTSFVAIRKDGPASPPEEARLVREKGSLLEYDARAQRWAAARPLRPGTVVEKKDAAGRVTSRFAAHSLALESISGMLIPVVHTTVEFLDGAGKPARRLRERYAPGLATATGGVFEKADPAAPGGFQPTLTFRLVAIAR